MSHFRCPPAFRTLLRPVGRPPKPLCSLCNRKHYPNGSTSESIGKEKFFCIYCGKRCESGETKRKLILCDSTLGGCGESDKKLKEHVNIEIHNGARIKDLEKVVKNVYLGDKSPIEVIVIGGLNDLVFDHKEAREVLEDLDELKKTIKNHNDENVISISTLPLVPGFTSLNVSDKKKNTLYDLPEAKNKINEFEAFNAGVFVINKQENVHFLKMNTVGVKGKGIGLKRKKVHQFDSTENPQFFIGEKNKLHFTNKYRFWFYHEATDYLIKGLKSRQ